MRYFSSIRIKTLLTISFVGIVNSSSYGRSVDNYFKELKSKYPDAAECIKKANTKAAEITSMYDEDEQRAAALVNLYTQSCKLDQTTFYALLNSNLRTGHSAPFWKKAGDLLNQGMVLLKESKFSDVYRGCVHPHTFKPGTLVRFHEFLSTSLSSWTAFWFALKNCRRSSMVIFNIKDAVGLDVSTYSAFSAEDEVLIKSSSVFEVVEVSSRLHRPYSDVVLRYTTQAYEPVIDLTCECELTTSVCSFAVCIILHIVLRIVVLIFVVLLLWFLLCKVKILHKCYNGIKFIRRRIRVRTRSKSE